MNCNMALINTNTNRRHHPGILLHIHFCQMEPSRAGTPQEPIVWEKQTNQQTNKQTNKSPQKQKGRKGNRKQARHGRRKRVGSASFMDTFNVEVTVTLMLNMLDEVTNTVQLIKSDYAGKPNQTKQNRDTTTDSAPSLSPLWSWHHDSHVLRLRSNDAELWRRD